jgi:single-stranded-DNA-specific exonuclease
MMEEAGILGKPLASHDIAFMIGPRINSCGRLGSSDKVVSLLLSKQVEDVVHLAQDLGKQNNLRKKIQKEILAKAEEFINLNKSCLLRPVLIVWGNSWHPGVIGIVAAKLVEMYGKPCIVITTEDNRARGSGRSVPGFSLYDAVNICMEYLIHFVGHPMAV